MEKNILKIYFAGDLFDAKDLGGNLLLAEAVEKCSCGRYSILLPQDGECEVTDRSSENIRDTDFELLFDCDILLANFDGTDLDSGTVAEFCFAKMIDMPALLLRTDFRNGGDAGLPGSDPWNLMCSHFPRTKVLWINAMKQYHLCKKEGKKDLAARFYELLAREIVRDLDDLAALPSWLGAEKLHAQLSAAVKSIGGGFPERMDEERTAALAERKRSSGLY